MLKKLILAVFSFHFLLPAAHDPDEGTLASGKPRIPEPMVYDLVRPLGAERGEWEINSLFFQPLRRGHPLQWAPEVEVALHERLALEFEVPMEGRALESLKFAAQGTFGLFDNEKSVHGWQFLSERFRETREWKLDFLYLTGTRWHRRWSTFTMLGPRREAKKGELAAAAVWNQSIFYHYARKVNFGMESNFKSATRLYPSYWLTMPQVTLRQSRYNIQFGAGSLLSARRWTPAVSWRLTREF